MSGRRRTSLRDLLNVLAGVGILCAFVIVCMPAYLESKKREQVASDEAALRLAAYRIARSWPEGRYPSSEQGVRALLSDCGKTDVRYLANGERFILWYARWFQASPLDPRELLSSPTLLVVHHYDPTNGITSPGVFALLVAEDIPATRSVGPLIPGKRVYPKWFDRPINY